VRRRLALFDIDGTILTDGGAAREAYRDALASVYGYDGDLARYDFSGRTDPQITHMVLGEFGLAAAEIDARIGDLWDAYLAGLARNATPGRVRMLDGIAALVDALARMEHVTLALLTGNVEPGARIKLGGVGLNDYFPFGAFGSDAHDREELPPIAVARATAVDGYRFAGSDVVIIGDSIYDVRCGVPHAATTIAIASGKTPSHMLRAENPDYLFASAADAGVLEAIAGAATTMPAR
jgi:phosphoglycolate phosphatase-like HAD superfamily hydrolase